MTIRALVVDDQALVRGSFRILVDTAPDLTSVGETANGTEAVELARRLIAEFTRHPETRLRPMAALDHITEREREVLTLIGLGACPTPKSRPACTSASPPPRPTSAACS